MTQSGQRSWWRVAVGAVGAALFALSANLAIGPLLSDDERLGSRFDDSLDHRAVFPGGVPPLTETFVGGRLGLTPQASDVRSARSTTADARSLAAVTSGRTLLEHRLTNDDFADAVVVPALPFTARTIDDDATRERTEPASCASSGRTVWYRYRPSRDLGLFANTFGSLSSTAIGVFRGDRVSDLQQVRCHASSNGDAHVAFAAKRGVTYHFQVAHGEPGRLVFSLDALGTTTRESLSSEGRELDDASGGASISGDGRSVAFTSWASRVTETDGENRCRYRPAASVTALACGDVFVRDLARGRTVHASVSTSGVGGNDLSAIASLSASGRYVTFASWSTNLIRGDTNGYPDIYLRDLRERRTERVSISSDERQGSAPSVEHRPIGFVVYDLSNLSDVTPDGRYVAFSTGLDGLVEGDRDGVRDVFVRDRRTGRTEKLSWRAGHQSADNDSFAPSISADGRFVAFQSFAGNLVEDDTNRCGAASCLDVFLFDRRTKQLRRVSVSSQGAQADNHSAHPAMSDDGRYIAFASTASTLVDRSPLADPISENIFVHDRLRRTTRRVSVSTGGQPQRGSPETFQPAPSKDPPVSRPGISGDGRYIAFASRAANLGPGDDGTIVDIFVHDVVTGATVGASVSSAGTFANGNSWNVTMSRAGTAVAFTSEASNLVRNDTNGCVDSQSTASCPDVFVHRFSRAR